MDKKKIRYLIMDVDGTLTDGKIYMGSTGEVMKAFNVKDGCGIHDLLIPNGIIPVIITGRESVILKNRCAELGITQLYQGVQDKRIVLEKLVTESHVSYSNIAYIGDDINDWSCMSIIKEESGILGCPTDSAKRIIEISDFVASEKGGEGAVREFIEWLLESAKKV